MPWGWQQRRLAVGAAGRGFYSRFRPKQTCDACGTANQVNISVRHGKAALEELGRTQPSPTAFGKQDLKSRPVGYVFHRTFFS